MSVVYAAVLLYYTFLCRIHLYVDVSASDYGHAVVTMSTGEKFWKLLQAIFGMQANGNLAGNYTQAFVLNVLLMIPLGYLVCLWLLDGDTVSTEEGKAGEAVIDLHLKLTQGGGQKPGPDLSRSGGLRDCEFL